LPSKSTLFRRHSEPPVGKLPGISSVEIQALAVLGALKDAGYRLSELDDVINLNPYQSPACSRRLAWDRAEQA